MRVRGKASTRNQPVRSPPFRAPVLFSALAIRNAYRLELRRQTVAFGFGAFGSALGHDEREIPLIGFFLPRNGKAGLRVCLASHEVEAASSRSLARASARADLADLAFVVA